MRFNITKPPPGSLVNFDHPLARGLVGCWLFNEPSGIVSKDLANRLVATQQNAPARTANKHGIALLLNGTTQYLTVPSGTSVLDITGPISFAAWVKQVTTSDYSHVYGGYLPGAPYTGCAFGLDSAGVGKATYYSSGGGGWVGANTAINDNTWHHIACAVAGTSCNFYTDGKADGTKVSSQPQSYTGARGIGALNDGTYKYKGAISTLMIFNRQLTANEIVWLYNEPFAMIQHPAQKFYLLPSGAAPPIIGRVKGPALQQI